MCNFTTPVAWNVHAVWFVWHGGGMDDAITSLSTTQLNECEWINKQHEVHTSCDGKTWLGKDFNNEAFLCAHPNMSRVNTVIITSPVCMLYALGVGNHLSLYALSTVRHSSSSSYVCICLARIVNQIFFLFSLSWMSRRMSLPSMTPFTATRCHAEWRWRCILLSLTYLIAVSRWCIHFSTVTFEAELKTFFNFWQLWSTPTIALLFHGEKKKTEKKNQMAYTKAKWRIKTTVNRVDSG